MELQQGKITKLEEQLQAQEGMFNHLKRRLDRQEVSALSRDRGFKQDSRYSPTYVPGYAYPPGSFFGYTEVLPDGIYLQPPWRHSRYAEGNWGYGPPAFGFNFRFGEGHHNHLHW